MAFSLDLSNAGPIVQAVEATWNSGDPFVLIALCSDDCHWRHGSERPTGHREILDHFLVQSTACVDQRVSYRIKSAQNRTLTLRYVREWGDDEGWFQASGVEIWRLSETGLIEWRDATLAIEPIAETDRTLRGEPISRSRSGPGSACIPERPVRPRESASP